MSYVPPIPQPVQPLPYVNPYHLRPRPGILTAVGILSIVIGVFSALASAGGAFGAMGFLMMSSTRFPGGITTSTTTQPFSTLEDGLDEASVALVLDEIERLQPLSETRRAHVKALLEQTGRRAFALSEEDAPTAQFIRSNITSHGTTKGVGGGSFYFIVGGGRIEVDDAGATFRARGTSESMTVSAGGSVAAWNNSTPNAPPATAPINPFGQINKSALWLMLVANGLSAALAVYLAVIGVMMLRDARSAGKLHWFYIAAKLPLIVLVTFASIWMWQGFFTGFSAAMPGTPAAPQVNPMVISAIVMAAVSAAYPIGLFFVLISKTVRDYYSPTME